MSVYLPADLLCYNLTQVSSKAWPNAKARETFKVRISEGSAKFYETIEIDEENGIEYFKVPPHNGLSETDRMYDFKMVRNTL